ncbi:uncharacterized protein CC84DRAFT_1084241 [Paraphaeosphaeria sporulosa]|uniref:Uncharacterized protein n=1 Tax=Paraphaeosphaeria sporulosa TaxID=1460663 RepID=A0A177CTM7_9PLEO|nr:uncharacterized protein CC84DRAFT_1084241 [Paraphaeosphaeria sporulosa]OAG10137.1 hypothetical protein CC84DRAFT_1084241 [Paraphaeosphaeria sporulosa]
MPFLGQHPNILLTICVKQRIRTERENAQNANKQLQSTSGPYRPTTWALGGVPKKNVDIPVTAVFLFLYIIGAATHMTIFQYNKRRGHKFLFNGMIFGFCMARITTCTLRIASISLPTNIRLAIAAQIFVAAGILLIFIINLIWSQRILRAHHPLGWHPLVRWVFNALYIVIIFTLAIVITAVVQSFYTLRPRTRTIDRALQLYGQTLFAVVAFLPIPIVALALALSRVGKREVETFGKGRHRTKIAVLMAGATLCCLGAAYRAGASWMSPVALSQPEPARFYRGWFYFMNFGLEILIVYMYAVMRVDLRFHIPNGAKGPGSYRVARKSEGDVVDVESLRAQMTRNSVESEKEEVDEV